MSKILVVEDDPAMSVALRDGFEFEKHVVAMAADGEEALRAARALDHDVIILDVMLPKKSGLDVCRAKLSCIMCGVTTRRPSRGRSTRTSRAYDRRSRRRLPSRSIC